MFGTSHTHALLTRTSLRTEDGTAVALSDRQIQILHTERQRGVSNPLKATPLGREDSGRKPTPKLSDHLQLPHELPHTSVSSPTKWDTTTCSACLIGFVYWETGAEIHHGGWEDSSACKHEEWRLTPRTHALKKLRLIPNTYPIPGEVEEGSRSSPVRQNSLLDKF